MPKGVYYRGDPVARFWSHVDRSAGPEGCWPWTACKTIHGYGWTRTGGIGHSAHRVAYTIANGPIPDGLVVCHRCDNRPCCNPAHLWLGTSADNAADCSAKGRTARGDRNGSRIHPDRLPRGDQSFARLHPERLVRGVDYWSAKLDEDKVRAIRLAAAAGESGRSLGLRFGVCKATIQRVVNRYSWKQVG